MQVIENKRNAYKTLWSVTSGKQRRKCASLTAGVTEHTQAEMRRIEDHFRGNEVVYRRELKGWWKCF